MKVEFLFDDGYQDIHRDGDPDLSFDSIVGGPVERFDAQVLLDPFEEEFDLPAATVEVGDVPCREREIVGQQQQSPPGFGVEVVNPPQGFRIVLAAVKALQSDDLIRQHSGGLVDGPRGKTLELEVALGPRDQEGRALINSVQAGEVQIAAIEDVESARLEDQLVEEIDVVNLARGDDDPTGNRAPQIQQGMQLHSRFVPAKLRPRKQRQAKVDGSGIQGISGLLQLHAKIVVGIKAAGSVDQHLSKIGVDPPIPNLIGIGQGIARDSASDAQVIQLASRRAQTGLDIAQTLSICQLGEGHRQKLVPAGKAFDLVMAVVAPDALVELVTGEKVHQLRKDRLAAVQGASPSAKIRKYACSSTELSNACIFLSQMSRRIASNPGKKLRCSQKKFKSKKPRLLNKTLVIILLKSPTSSTLGQ